MSKKAYQSCSASPQQLQRKYVAVGTDDIYHIEIINFGNRPWSFFLFQVAPGAQTLAWVVTPNINNGGAQCIISWYMQYQMMWGNGQLVPGDIFTAGGEVDANLTDKNSATFTIQNNIPTLSLQPFGGGAEGTLSIKDGPSVPSNKYSVAVGLATHALYAINAGPNMTHVFKPSTTTYWVCAIDQVVEGEVMDISTLTRKAQITFPANVYSMTAVLQGDDTWIIS